MEIETALMGFALSFYHIYCKLKYRNQGPKLFQMQRGETIYLLQWTETPTLVFNLNSSSLHALAEDELLSVSGLRALEFFSILEIRKKVF